MTTPAASIRTRESRARAGLGVQGWLSSAVVMCIGLYVASLAARGFAVLAIEFPINEGSAYYVDVARNLVDRTRTGHRLDLELLHPAAGAAASGFRAVAAAWRRSSSAASMSVFGTGFDAARVGGSCSWARR